jgi:hypothetical protein
VIPIARGDLAGTVDARKLLKLAPVDLSTPGHRKSLNE